MRAGVYLLYHAVIRWTCNEIILESLSAALDKCLLLAA